MSTQLVVIYQHVAPFKPSSVDAPQVTRIILRQQPKPDKTPLSLLQLRAVSDRPTREEERQGVVIISEGDAPI
jgi:hypothetical protein